MSDLARVIWYEGFMAGECCKPGCPYVPHTDEAEAWYSGWVQGILKRNHHDYREEPLDHELRGK